MNNFNGIGRLTRDPELRYIKNGTAVANFTIAIDKGLSKEMKKEFEEQNKPTADFINVVTWGKTAEFSANFLEKGLMTGISGRVETSTYKDADGKTIYKTEVNCMSISMIEWRDNNNSNTSNDFGAVEGFHPVDNDDIPF